MSDIDPWWDALCVSITYFTTFLAVLGRTLRDSLDHGPELRVLIGSFLYILGCAPGSRLYRLFC
jgi:hypothetical protein